MIKIRTGTTVRTSSNVGLNRITEIFDSGPNSFSIALFVLLKGFILPPK